MRIALIGLGDIAQKAYLPILANHSNIHPVLCSRKAETLAKLAQKYRINEVYESIDELIINKPEAAMVHSSTESHYEIIKKLLLAKIPVYVDKPLCYSMEECEDLLNLSIKNKTLLYVGFNRRFVPMIQKVDKETEPYQITWTKNRANLPGDPRVFIYDDFIHVIDSLRFLGKGPVKDINVRCIKNDGLLESIQVHWKQNNTLMQGNMNRMSGFTQELVEYYSKGSTWIIKDFITCSHFKEEREEVLKTGNWDSTLYIKGFNNLIEDWLRALQDKVFNEQRIQDIRDTHQLCEQIVQEVLRS